MYPVTIVDNFFPDPDKIVEFALQQEYTLDSRGTWPGLRTRCLSEICENLHRHVGRKIHSLFYETTPNFWSINMYFQRVKPFSDEQYDFKNVGWIHSDNNNHFGGVIYLNKNSEKDTGTSIFYPKFGYFHHSENARMVKEKFYLNEEVSDEEYYTSIHSVNSQFEESIKVENRYNRMILFPSNAYHGAQTFGTKGERLTLAFFSNGVFGSLPPLSREP